MRLNPHVRTIIRRCCSHYFWARAAYVALSLSLIFSAVAEAQYQRHIEAVLPRVGQQGTTVEVLIQGLHLEDPQEVLFYRPGIRAVEIERIPDLQQFDADGKLNPIDKRPGGRAFGAKVEQQVRCKFVIAPDCPIGLHPLKMRTGSQLTTLSTFWVTPYPVQNEAEPVQGVNTNNDLNSAETVAAENSTVFGYINSQGGSALDRDVYRIKRKKGERISVEVNSVRVSSIWWARAELDLLVRIRDADGKELAMSDDSALHVQDPVLSIEAPQDGDYFLEIEQSLFSNLNNSFYLHYLAHIGTFERPQAVYPAGGPAGKPLKVSLIGDPKGDRDLTISLPSEKGDFPLDFGGPSVLPMRVSDYRNVLESTVIRGNGGNEQAGEHPATEAGEIPVALNGVVSQPNEVDVFRLRPEKDKTYLVRVFARSLGTPLDPQIEIVHEESGEVEAVGDDVQNYEERGLPGVPVQFRRLEIMDPSLVWTPKQAGTYLLRISDVRNQGSPTCVYRVEATPVENRVNTFVFSRNYNRESPRDSSLAIPQGNRWTLQFGLSQGQGNPFRGDLKLVAEGLPPGVEMIAPLIQASGDSYPSTIPVQFVAQPDTAPQASLIRVLARPVEDVGDFRSRGGQAFLFVGDHFGQSSNSLVVEQYAFAVTNPAPFSIEVVPPRIPLIQNGELSVVVKLHRAPGFDDPVALRSAWNPSGVGSEPTLEIPAGETEAIYRFTASSNAPPATWKVAIQASTLPLNPKDVAGAGLVQVSSKFFDLTVARPYVELTSEPVAIRRGAVGEFVWKVGHLSPFKADASARLSGLPKGVSVEEPAPLLKPDATQLVFHLRANEDALLGQYKEIGVELMFREDGQEIRQRTGAGVLRIDPPLQK